MKYSYWKLLRAQWSWNNIKELILMVMCVNFICTGILTLTGGFTLTDTVTKEVIDPSAGMLALVFLVAWLVYSVSCVVMYQTLKVLLLTPVMCFITYHSNKGVQEAINLYNEALTWRQ